MDIIITTIHAKMKEVMYYNSYLASFFASSISINSSSTGTRPGLRKGVYSVCEPFINM